MLTLVSVSVRFIRPNVISLHYSYNTRLCNMIDIKHKITKFISNNLQSSSITQPFIRGNFNMIWTVEYTYFLIICSIHCLLLFDKVLLSKIWCGSCFVLFCFSLNKTLWSYYFVYIKYGCWINLLHFLGNKTCLFNNWF